MPMSSPSDKGSRTILWCVPRAISSAVAKCVSFIEDNEVWFDPYIFCHLASVDYKLHTKTDIPMEYEGNEEAFEKARKFLSDYTKSNIVADRIAYATVKRRLESTTSKHVFVKDQALAVTEGYRQYIPGGFKHTFLIRNPVRSIYSYRKAQFKQGLLLGQLEGEAANEQTFDLDRDDHYFLPGCFVKEQYDIWVYVKENFDSDPVVIDSDDLLTKPKETLSAYCAAVGLPYNDSLLQWDASTDVLKKMKAPGDDLLVNMVNFFSTAMRSSEFLPQNKLPPLEHLTPDVIRCSDRVMKYYEEMHESRLKV